MTDSDENPDAPSESEAPPWPGLGAIPEIRELRRNLIPSYLVRVLIGKQPFEDSSIGRQHFVNAVRLAAKAGRDFEAGRVAAETFAARNSEGYFSPYYEAVDHFEACVSACYRVHCYIERLRKLGAQIGVGKRDLATRRDRLRKLRDRIEHASDDIARGRVPIGQAPLLLLMSDALVFGDLSMTYVDLAEEVKLITDVVAGLMPDD